MNFGVAPFPANDGKESITLGVQDYFFGFKKEGNQEAIQKFLSFLFEPDNYAGFLEAAGGFLPATKSAGEAMSSDRGPGAVHRGAADGDLLPQRPGRLAGRPDGHPADHRHGAGGHGQAAGPRPDPGRDRGVGAERPLSRSTSTRGSLPTGRGPRLRSTELTRD